MDSDAKINSTYENQEINNDKSESNNRQSNNLEKNGTEKFQKKTTDVAKNTGAKFSKANKSLSESGPSLILIGGKNNGNNKARKKRRRGKKTNWKFQMPQRLPIGNQVKTFQRWRSTIVPYNTNKFLMEEHMDEVPPSVLLLTQDNYSRTRDSSFSVDSEDNYFFSLPEKDEDFLTKEFSNVYESTRSERFEQMSKEQLIQECLQIEDRYQQQDMKLQQKYAAEFMAKIKFLEDKVKDLTRQNYDLRKKLDHATINLQDATNAQASNKNILNDVIEGDDNSRTERMQSCSEDSESDSSSSSSSTSSSSSSSSSRSSSVSGPNGIRSPHIDSEDNDVNGPINARTLVNGYAERLMETDESIPILQSNNNENDNSNDLLNGEPHLDCNGSDN